MRCFNEGSTRRQAIHRRRGSLGFTLIELIAVTVIIAVLAAMAMPRFLDLGRDARIASLQTMSGALWGAANNVRAKCALMPDCDLNSFQQFLIIAGQYAAVNYGWPEAGETANDSQIDIWLNYSGFTISFPNGLQHKFSLDGSPDPNNCAVIYEQAWLYTQHTPVVTLVTSGC